MNSTVFNGTSSEATDLQMALDRNCGYQYGPMGARVLICGSHEAMLHDQRFVDGVVFVRRRLRDRLKAEEWSE